MPGTTTGWRMQVDSALVRPMAWLSIAYLVLLAAALPQLPEELSAKSIPDRWIAVCFVLIALVWPVFIMEFALRMFALERGAMSRGRLLAAFAAAVIPPLRLGLAPASKPGAVWLPMIGWAQVGRPMARRVERLMSGPMMAVAIMILPALALEFVFRDEVEHSRTLQTSLDVSLRVIWLAFAVELSLMLAASRAKIAYARQHWVDVAIVVFPLIAFLRALRLLRLGQVVKASKLASIARTFRLRAVALRFVRALLLLRVLERISLPVAEKRVEALRSTIAKRRREIAELQEEIDQIEAHIARRKAERDPPPSTLSGHEAADADERPGSPPSRHAF
jgi:voltage-gated potassium channel